MNENMVYLCRLCLKKSEFKFSLFTGNILDKIQTLTSIKIKEDDKLPQTCCESCVANVYTSYKFQQCIIESDKTLREKLVHNESQIIEHAKQTPDVFEVLHVESSTMEPKLENVGELPEEICDFIECITCKTEPLNLASSTTDNQSLKYCLVKSDSSDDLNNENNINFAVEVDTSTLNGNCEANDQTIVDGNTMIDICDTENIANLDVKGKYQKKRKSSDDGSVNFCNTDDVLTKLGIQTKFFEKFAAYRENRKIKQTVFECVDCNVKFESKRMLQRHMIKHKVDKCPFCSIMMRSDNLKRHIQIHTDSPEICEICGKRAKNKESLRGHVNYQHKNNVVLKCDFCSREFKSTHHLKTHVRKIHLGIKNHQCHICGKKFFANHDLNKHINMTHRGARPFVCQYCKKGFSSPYARKTHIRQHTLETPFRCEICAAGFRQKVSLLTHLKSKHSIVSKSKSD